MNASSPESDNTAGTELPHFFTMSRLFSSLRRGSAAAPTAVVDEKDHGDDDDADIELGSASSSSSSSSGPLAPLLPTSPAPSSSSSFALRIKFNDGKSTTDYKLSNIPTASGMTVGMLKARILSEYDRRAVAARATTATGGPAEGGTTTTATTTSDERYLRLITRGRMMAPDRNTLAAFCIVNDDVIHAVLTIQPPSTTNDRSGGIMGGSGGGGGRRVAIRRGQQARMLHRMNNNYGNSSSDASGRGVGGGGGAIPSLWRRTGIDYNGIVIPPRDMTNNDNNNEEDDSTSSSEDDDDDDDIDVYNNDIVGAGDIEGNSSRNNNRSRRPRERRGFDRLRATGMTREEVATIRAYFARSVNRYIDRRRIILAGSRRLRETLDNLNALSQQQRGRTESTNSLLDNTATTTTTAAATTAEAGGVGEQSSAVNNGGSGGAISTNTSNIDTANSNTNNSNEGEEEILNDRLRMEDEWMSTQGPYSEFRMNLNTSNPLLLAAITGTGGGGGGVSGMVDPMITATMGAGIGGARGLFFRSRTSSNNPNNNDNDDTDDDDLFGQSLSTGTTPGVGFNGAGSFHPYMMGPLPPAGTDKDFVWGFILGFFVGFVMLFWVWMPTVPHRQKLGIISGISFQLALNLLRKSTQTDVAI